MAQEPRIPFVDSCQYWHCRELTRWFPSEDVFLLCRKKKAVHKVSTTDDKRLQATLKRLGVNTIPGIEEVNLFVENDVIHFTNPKGNAQSLALSILFFCCCLMCFHAAFLGHVH